LIFISFSIIMLKLLVFTIFLVSSPTFGLLETLFQTENDCYSGCHSNYPTSLLNLDACKKGCDYKLQDENCAGQCKLLSIHQQAQASCVVGCSMSHPEIQKPVENERPRSVILIRIRQHPSAQPSSLNTDPIQMFHHMINQFKMNANRIKQSEEIPKSFNDRLQRFINDIRSKWNDLVRKQPNIPIWILLAIFLSASAILWYMIVSLCRHTPRHHTLSVRPQEFVLDDTYEKEKIQPNEQHYEVKQSLPIKVKFEKI